MSTQVIYKCKLTNYSLEFIITNDIATINLITCDWKNLQAFFALLRSSIDKLKEIPITKIRQHTTCDDWHNLLKDKTTWEIIGANIDNQCYTMECDIDDFLENFGIGIGVFDDQKIE